jgi:hypothetical protein
MSPRQLRTKAPIDAFAWQYASYAQLIYRKAPASNARLSDLAQVMYSLKGHLDPKAAADEILATWPFADETR